MAKKLRTVLFSSFVTLNILLLNLNSNDIISILSFDSIKLPVQLLKLIFKYRYGVSIDTKSDLILRDIDLLKEINSKNNVIVKFTITTPKDELSKKIEPHVCVSSKRFEAIKKLAEGVPDYLEVPVEAELLDKASAIINGLGYDMEDAISIFLQRTIQMPHDDIDKARVEDFIRGIADATLEDMASLLYDLAQRCL